jgi:putative transposase
MMTTINRSYKIRCYLSPAQEDLFARTGGCCRYVYNRVAREISEAFKNGIKKSVVDMSREVTQWKKDEETQWLADVPSGAITQSLRDLEKG